MSEPRDPLVYPALAAMILLWGFDFLLVKIATTEADPAFVAGFRAAIGAAVAGLIALSLGRFRLPPRALWPACALIGLLGVSAPFALLSWAAPRLPSGVIGVYMASIPLFVLLLSHFLSPVLRLNERMTAATAMGVCLGAIGIAILFGPERLADLGRADALASLVCLASCFGTAISSITIRVITRREPKPDLVGVAFLQLLFGTLFLAPLAVQATPDAPLSTATWATLLALGVATTGIPTILRVFVVKSAGPVFMSTAGYLVPVTALIVGWAFVGETFSSRELAGAAIILLGVGTAQGLLRPPRLRAARRPGGGHG